MFCSVLSDYSSLGPSMYGTFVFHLYSLQFFSTLGQQLHFLSESVNHFFLVFALYLMHLNVWNICISTSLKCCCLLCFIGSFQQFSAQKEKNQSSKIDQGMRNNNEVSFYTIPDQLATIWTVLSLKRGDLKTIVYIWWKVGNFYCVSPLDFKMFESFLLHTNTFWDPGSLVFFPPFFISFPTV